MTLLLLLTSCVLYLGDSAPDEPDPRGRAGDCESPGTFYYDADGDGWGDERLVQRRCTAGEGFVETVGDCDDLEPDVHPQAVEICDNARDDDCDGPNGTLDGIVDCEDSDCAGHPACPDDTGSTVVTGMTGMTGMTGITGSTADTGTGVTDTGTTDTGTGTGTGSGPPVLVAAPLTHDFGLVYSGSSSSVTITVGNTGGLPATVYAVIENPTPDGDFGFYSPVYTADGMPPWVIPPSSSIQFDMQCTPNFSTFLPDVHEVRFASEIYPTPVVTLTCQTAS